MNKEQVEKNTIFKCITGSRAYGTNTQDSDTDIRGVCIPEIDYFFGIKRFEQFIDNESTIYDLRKALNLIAAANPNMLELLFIPERCFLKITPIWNNILESRDSFISTRVKSTYSGYAIAQIRRIRTHRGWLLNPPKKKPERSEFGLKEGSSIPLEQLLAIISIENKFLSDEWKEIAFNERKYNDAMRNWNNYKEWEQNRNRKRFELEKKFGYDTKHAQNLVRLTRQGIEFLETGELRVDRTGIDAEELVAIKNGAWTYEEVEEYCNKIDPMMEEAHLKTKLKKVPDMNMINNICICSVEEFHKNSLDY